jgi:hypothetical protein
MSQRYLRAAYYELPEGSSVTRRDAIIALVGAAIGAVLGTAGALLVALMIAPLCVNRPGCGVGDR